MNRASAEYRAVPMANAATDRHASTDHRVSRIAASAVAWAVASVMLAAAMAGCASTTPGTAAGAPDTARPNRTGPAMVHPSQIFNEVPESP